MTARAQDRDARAWLDRLRSRLAGLPRVEAPLPEGFRDAAVLVPIVMGAAGEGGARGAGGETSALLFTARPDGMPTHAGQISFPGGKCERDDGGPVATALRELEEELGVPAGRVRVLGILDDVLTPSGFRIAPVVGVIEAPLALRPNGGEVAEAFTVSLRTLAAPAVYRAAGTRELAGLVYEMHEYHAAGRRIWGATARMIRQLLELLRDGGDA